MKSTDNFFDRKRSWSKLKDEILVSYLTPYITKISHTGYPTTIVDCFAGKGRFDDGQSGSPLYIAKAVDEFKTNKPQTQINGIFVEQKYFDDLRKNLCSFRFCNLLDNDYEKWISEFLSENLEQKQNLLLYVDPYGIKHIPFKYFKRICDLNLNSFELLLNFNSFGFLREGCRLLEIREFDCNEDSDVYEKDDANSIQRMNAIAGGNYWQEILGKYSKENFSMKEAERELSECYTQKLKSIFNYVVNIPIKQKRSHLPKYRIVFGTNSEDGLLLVADKMSRTWKNFVEGEREGQQPLFKQFDFPDAKTYTFEKLEEVIWNLLKEPLGLKTLLVKLIEKYGISYSESELKNCCRKMEQDRSIIVKRLPSFTPTGKTATSWEYGKYRIDLERGQSCQKSLL